MDNKDMVEFEGYDPEYYDITSGENLEDVSFYLDIAREAKGKVLEVACGTGRIYLELIRAGVDIRGIDLSEKMLDALKRKAADMELKPKVIKADMRHFKLDDTFTMILIPFRSFLHNITIDEQLSTLKCCREHLTDGGRLVMNFFYPNRNNMAEKYGRVIARPMSTPVEGMELVTWSGFVNEPDQVIVTEFTWKQDGKVVSRFRTQLAYIYRREFELLLRLAGFSSWKVYGGFDYQPLEAIDQEMVWVVQK